MTTLELVIITAAFLIIVVWNFILMKCIDELLKEQAAWNNSNAARIQALEEQVYRLISTPARFL